MRPVLAVAVLGALACNGGPRSEAPPPAPPPAPEDRVHPRGRPSSMRCGRRRRRAWTCTTSPRCGRGQPPRGRTRSSCIGVSEARYVGALRGTGQLVLLDGEANTIATAKATVDGVSGWTWEGAVAHVVGERSREVHRFVVEGGRDPAQGIVVDRGRPRSARHRGAARRRVRAGGPPSLPPADLRQEEDPRARAVRRLHCRCWPRATPSWPTASCSIASTARRSSTTVRSGGSRPTDPRSPWRGVEDHPLDRSDGSFGYIDSFVFVYEDGKRTAEINVGMEGLVTPKWLRWADPDTIEVAGYGSPLAARIRDGKVTTIAVPPGITSVAGSLSAGARGEPTARRVGRARRRRARARLPRRPAAHAGAPGRGARVHHADGSGGRRDGQAEPLHLRDVPLRGHGRRSHPSHGPRRRAGDDENSARAVREPAPLHAGRSTARRRR